MSCETYKVALIEAAVTGDDMPPAECAHAAACSSCAAELAQQRSLIAAIDANLARTMNAPVPAAMLQRLEARIAQQNPRRPLNLSWVYATATLAASAAMILFAVSYLRAHKSSSHTAAAQTAQSTAEHRPEIMTAILQPATPEEIRRNRRQHARSTVSPQAEVLVPPDERIALEHFIADLHGREGMALALAKRVPEQREQKVAPVDTPDIQIASVTVSPIRDTDTSSFTNNNK